LVRERDVSEGEERRRGGAGAWAWCQREKLRALTRGRGRSIGLSLRKLGETLSLLLFIVEDGYWACLGLLGLGLFGGGHYSVPASKNGFMEAGALIDCLRK
jgi:hypothetical protein